MVAEAATKAPYIVTDKAGPRPDIAGRLRVVGSELMLTAAQAKWELSRGVIITKEEHDRRQAEAAKAPAGDEPEKA